MAKAYPEDISEVADLRHALSQLRLTDLAVGKDNRNRTLLRPFAARTSRNQPSTSQYIFGNSIWVRSFIKPEKGMAIAMLDWEQQEMGIAADLSGDKAMIEAYLSGDMYLAFAKRVGAVPPDATKTTHKKVRSRYKATVLAINYGQSEFGLAERIDEPLCVACDLMKEHRRTYKEFWAWSDAALTTVMLQGSLTTRFGWQVLRNDGALKDENPPPERAAPVDKTNPRSMRNFPVQSNAAEMMRIAACQATEQMPKYGAEVVAVIHDAFMIYAPVERIKAAAAAMKDSMEQASRDVLNDLSLRVECNIVAYPNRYRAPERGAFWDTVMEQLLKAVIDERGSAALARRESEEAA